MQNLADMSLENEINLGIAVGTLLAAAFAAYSAWFAGRAVREATRQIVLSREGLIAQSYLSVTSYEREIEFSRKMDMIRALPTNMTYEALTPVQCDDIRAVVDFLNHVAHLIRYRYVNPVQILLLYTPSIEACQEILVERIRWLERLRSQADNQKLYLHFESLCSPANRDAFWKDKHVPFTGDVYLPPEVLIRTTPVARADH